MRRFLLTNANGLLIRWINAQCVEMRLPNGSAIITDPWFSGGCKSMERLCPKDFSVDDIEACDYIFISHSHGDHIANIQQIIDKFNPVIVMHSAIAAEFARSFDVPLNKLYPVDYGGKYCFNGFSVKPSMECTIMTV